MIALPTRGIECFAFSHGMSETPILERKVYHGLPYQYIFIT